MSKWVSAIEIPEGSLDKTQNVPHGEIRMKKYWSEMTQTWRMLCLPAQYDEDTETVILYCICNMVAVKMKPDGVSGRRETHG